MQMINIAILICVLLLGRTGAEIIAGEAIPTRSGHVAKDKKMEITESSNGKTIHLAVGQRFTIKLKETAGTGYRWSFVRNGAPAVSLIDESFHTGAHRLGAAGTRKWLLEAVSPGQTTIEMNLSRPWDANSVTRSFLLCLNVT
jgi:predicted secreted protein